MRTQTELWYEGIWMTVYKNTVAKTYGSVQCCDVLHDSAISQLVISKSDQSFTFEVDVLFWYTAHSRWVVVLYTKRKSQLGMKLILFVRLVSI